MGKHTIDPDDLQMHFQDPEAQTPPETEAQPAAGREQDSFIKRIHYRGGTLNAIDEIRNLSEEDSEKLMEHIVIEEKKHQRVFTEGTEEKKKLHLQRPSDQDRSNTILLAPLNEGLKKGELANEYYNISPQYLSMLISPDYGNKVTQNLIISAVLLPRKPVTVDDVNHILMELCLPGLFDKTGDKAANRRNRVLCKLLEYAQTNPCPRKNWLLFAHEVLAYLRMDALYTVSKKHRAVSPDCLSEEEETLAEGWRGDSGNTEQEPNYMTFRNECFKRYREENDLRVNAAYSALYHKIHIDEDTIKTLVSSSSVGDKTHGSRPTLIQLAIHMGCDLNEANRMLMEANYALLYPLREDEDELKHIHALLKNGIRRENREKGKAAQDEQPVNA